MWEEHIFNGLNIKVPNTTFYASLSYFCQVMILCNLSPHLPYLPNLERSYRFKMVATLGLKFFCIWLSYIMIIDVSICSTERFSRIPLT